MYPKIFTIPIGGGIPIHSYGVMLGISFIVAWVLTQRMAIKDRMPAEKIGTLFIVVAVSSVVGSRLLFVITNMDQIGSLWQVFLINQGGLVAYGGLLGGFISSWLYCRSQGISLLGWADVGCPLVAAGLGFTRIGCFLFGCDYGRISWDFGWAVQFPAGSPAWAHHFAGELTHAVRMESAVPALWGLEEWISISNVSHPVHPTQLYSSLNGWICFAFLMLVRRYYRRFAGQIFILFFGYYAVTRFGLEMVRDDLQRGYIGPLTTSQFFSVITVVAASAAYYYLHRRAQADPQAARPWESPQAAPARGDVSAGSGKDKQGKTLRDDRPAKGSKTEKGGPGGKRSKGKGSGRKRKGRKRRSR